MCMTSGTDGVMMPNNGMKSPPTEESNSVGGNGRLKKGPWTSAEDAILVEYVTKHGEGNWNAVQRHTGLARCGKSCRLRWANHLRPDLKKGAFTPEEEHLIIELHSKMGNKWARMAAEMPGRTDNEIKNYWNTRIKRRQRAGLPIYPPDICLQSFNENQHTGDMNTFSSSGDAHSHDATPVNNFEIPAVQFKSLELNQHMYPPAFLDMPSGGFLAIPASGFMLHSQPKNFMVSTMHPAKRHRGPESVFPVPDQYQIGSYVQNAQAFTYSSSAYDDNSSFNHLSSSTVLAGSHAVINGNPSSSSSELIWAMEEELPSLQTQADNWGSPSSPLPPLESADTEHKPSCKISSQNSGLLEEVLHQSQTMDGSSQFINEMGWEPHWELTSPLGHSSSSMFSQGNGEHKAITGYRTISNNEMQG